MEEHKHALHTAIIVCVALLAVTVLLVVLFFGGSNLNEHEAITLPETSAASVEDEPEVQPDQNPFAEVTRENVQDVLRSLTRPSSYYQKCTILTYSGGSCRQQQADIWRSGELLRADLSDEFGTKSILTDGKTLCIWYDGDETPLILPLRAGVNAEELIGIPTVETLLSVDPGQIQEAEFVTLEEQPDLACIYVSFFSDGCTQGYWVNVESGLLCRQSIQQDNAPVYILQQLQFELLIGGDETLAGAFCLPDGTDPFAELEQ